MPGVWGLILRHWESIMSGLAVIGSRGSEKYAQLDLNRSGHGAKITRIS